MNSENGIQIIHPIYRCKEQVLLNKSTKAWLHYMEQFAYFKKFSEYYTEDRALQLVAQIRSVQQTYFTETTTNNISYDTLKKLSRQICLQWQFLKRYIQGAYPKKFHKSKINNAGIEYYFTAYRYNFEDVNQLISKSVAFLHHYNVMLQLDNNMPESFYTTYIELCSQFENAFVKYQEDKLIRKEEKYEKIKQLNAIYKQTSEMLHDAKAIFATDKTKLKLFAMASLQ